MITFKDNIRKMKLKTKTCLARLTFRRKWIISVFPFPRLTSRLTFRKWIVFIFVFVGGASWEMEKE